MPTTKRLLPAAIIAAASLAAASNAGAATYCANTPAPCDGTNGTYIAGLQNALDAAAAQDGHDKIVLGNQEYVTPNGFYYDTADEDRTVEIVGKGDGTVLKADAWLKNNHTVLDLNAEGVVRNLKVLVPSSSNGFQTVGVHLNRDAQAKNVTVADNGVADGADIGISMGEGAVYDSSITMNDATATRGVNVYGTVSLVMGSAIKAGTALRTQTGGVLQAGRNRIDARWGALAYGGTLTVFDSSIKTRTSAGVGLAAVAATGNAALRASQVTQFGTAWDTDAVLASSGNANSAHVDVENSALAGQGASLTTVATGAGQAGINTDASAFDGSVTDHAGPGGISMTSTIEADPKLVDPENGDVRLQPGSPLIDAGIEPKLSSNAIDLYGSERPIDGDGNGVAKRDIGAAERLAPVVFTPPAQDDPQGGGQTPGPQQPGGEQPPKQQQQTTPVADAVAPVVSNLRLKLKRSGKRRGARVRFALSEASRVTIKVQRKRGGTFRTVATLRRSLQAGTRSVKLRKATGKRRLRVVVTAVDAAGNRSAAKRLRFRVKR